MRTPIKVGQKPTLADLLGNKPFKSQRELRNAVTRALELGTAVGSIGVNGDHREVGRMSGWWIEEIEDAREHGLGRFAMAAGNDQPRKKGSPTVNAERPREPQTARARAKSKAGPKETQRREQREEAAEKSGAEAVADAIAPERPKLPEGSRGPYTIMVGEITAGDPIQIALTYSRTLGQEVVLMDAVGNMLKIKAPDWEHRDGRVTPRPGAVRRQHPDAEPTSTEDMKLRLIALALRQEGVTRAECVAVGGDKINYQTYFGKLEAEGYVFTFERGTPRANNRYKLIKA
jgi:hypothetical protein